MEDKKDNILNVESAEFSNLIEKLEDSLRAADVDAVNIMTKLLEAQTDLSQKLTERSMIMGQAVKMLITADTSLDSFNNLGEALIIRLQERELELIRESLAEKYENGVVTIKDTIEFPQRDTEGNIPPGAHFSGELIWTQTEEQGVSVYKVSPDALSGISFTRLPLLMLDPTAAILAFEEEQIEPTFRFISNRIGEGFAQNIAKEEIGNFSEFESKVKFTEKHNEKMDKILGLVKAMKEVRGYELLGLNVEETFDKILMATKEGKAQKTENKMYTAVTGIFRRTGELTTVSKEGIKEGLNGSIIQEEWIIDENPKSKTKITVRSVASANQYVAKEEEIKTLESALKTLLKVDRQVLIERYNRSKENTN